MRSKGRASPDVDCAAYAQAVAVLPLVTFGVTYPVSYNTRQLTPKRNALGRREPDPGSMHTHANN